jgi:DNA-binding response OmpR family regulator
VLIADESALMRILLSATLSRRRYRIIEADCGPDALRFTLAARPSLVLMDAALPGIDGFEVCQEMRATVSMQETGVILLGVDATEAARQKSGEVGADRYLSKPFSPLELLEAIEDLQR